MNGDQCYELLGGIALKNHAFFLLQPVQTRTRVYFNIIHKRRYMGQGEVHTSGNEKGACPMTQIRYGRLNSTVLLEEPDSRHHG